VKRTYDPGPDGAGLRPLLVKECTGGSSPLSLPLPLLSRLLMHAPYGRAEAMDELSPRAHRLPSASRACRDENGRRRWAGLPRRRPVRPSTAPYSVALYGHRVIEGVHSVKLPNADAAVIPQAKIAGYLLSPTHRAGRSKAAFFGKHGFKAADWQLLAQSLRAHAGSNAVSRTEETAFGMRYVIDGLLHAPDGTALNVRSVWFISWGIGVPRFATAHPLKRKSQ